MKMDTLLATPAAIRCFLDSWMVFMNSWRGPSDCSRTDEGAAPLPPRTMSAGLRVVL